MTKPIAELRGSLETVPGFRKDNDIDYDIPPASEPSYYTEPKITPKPFQYYIPNTTTSTYSNYPIEDLFPTNLQTVADDRQDTSIIFGVPVANFGVS